jgi:O-glycosyl hydrolase
MGRRLRSGVSRVALAIAILLVGCVGQTSTPVPSSPTAITQPSSGGAHETPAAHITPAGHPPHPGATPSPLPEAAFTPSAVVTIQVDGAIRYQTFTGFGAALTPFEWDGIYRAHDPTQPAKVTASQTNREAIARLLFTDLGIAHARLFVSGFEPVNDNADPFTLNPAGFDWTRVNWLTDFLALARPAGLQSWWASFTMTFNQSEDWLRLPGDPCHLDSNKMDEEVEWLLAGALRFREAGFELPYLAVQNEPDLGPGCPNGPPISVEDYVTIVKRLGARMRAEGLTTQIIVSDGWTPQNALRYMQATLDDLDARPYVGVLAYHSYSDGYDEPVTLLKASAQGQPPHAAVGVREQIRNLAAQYNLPVWMTEICYCTPRNASDFDLVRGRLNHVHDELTIANVSAFDAMQLFFIDRPGVRDELVHVYFGPDGTLERYEISIYGYLLGHYSRFVVPGSVRLNVESGDPRVRVTAFERPDGRLVIVALNNNPFAVQANISLANLGRTPAALSILTRREDALWQSQPDITLEDGSATTVLPPLSVTTFIGR